MSRIETVAAALEFLKQEGDDWQALEKVPEELRTLEVCIAAAAKDVEALQFAPKALWNAPDFCLEAVQLCGQALMMVPQEMKTPELCLTVVRQNGWTLEWVPEEMVTPELILSAVRQDGRALQLVPQEMRTPELCLTAVRQDGWALEFVPEEAQTPELCVEAVRQDGELLESYMMPAHIKQEVELKLKQEA